MGRPVWTHEMAGDKFNEELREKVKPDFLKICNGEEVHLHLRNKKTHKRQRGEFYETD